MFIGSMIIHLWQDNGNGIDKEMMYAVIILEKIRTRSTARHGWELTTRANLWGRQSPKSTSTGKGGGEIAAHKKRTGRIGANKYCNTHFAYVRSASCDLSWVRATKAYHLSYA